MPWVLDAGAVISALLGTWVGGLGQGGTGAPWGTWLLLAFALGAVICLAFLLGFACGCALGCYCAQSPWWPSWPYSGLARAAVGAPFALAGGAKAPDPLPAQLARRLREFKLA